VLPLQFLEGEGANVLGLDGSETYTIDGIATLEPRQEMAVQVKRTDGSTQLITARCRIDTYNELEYYRSGGILQFVLRNLAS
jgi:aconitate hydratase